MRIGHARSCCSGQNGANRSPRRLFSIFCFSLGFSIAFGVLGFEEPSKKKETWMSLMKHGHQWGFVHESRTEKNISKNNLNSLSSWKYILQHGRRCSYSAFKAHENCWYFNGLRTFHMPHIIPGVFPCVIEAPSSTKMHWIDKIFCSRQVDMHTSMPSVRACPTDACTRNILSWRKSRFGDSQCYIYLGLWILLTMTRSVSAPGQPICRQ